MFCKIIKKATSLNFVELRKANFKRFQFEMATEEVEYKIPIRDGQNRNLVHLLFSFIEFSVLLELRISA